MKILNLIFIIILASFFFRCSTSVKESITLVTVRQEWFPNANYAGELMASKEFAKAENIKIKIEAGSDNIDPVKLVLSGKNDFGVVGADKILAANQNGANLVIIGVINYNSPVCFLSLAKNKIKIPHDFENKKVGILTGTATEYVYRAMIKKAITNPESIKEVEAPFDLTTFITGEYDVRPAFIYDEPVSLDMQNIKYDLIIPSDYGISFIGTVYFTTKKMIQEKPEVVQSFINSVRKGWERVISNPELSIRYLKEYDNSIDTIRELNSLKKGINYFTGYNSRVLASDSLQWAKMVNSLVDLGILKSSNIGNSVDTTFISNSYRLENK